MPRIFDNIEDQLLPALRETIALSDRADYCEHINDSLIRHFKISKDWGTEDWAAIWGRLEKGLNAHSERKVISTKEGHRIEYQEMDASLTKPIIDEIDSILAKHYGFTEEELDFINYDIKYRMGQNSEDNDE